MTRFFFKKIKREQLLRMTDKVSYLLRKIVVGLLIFVVCSQILLQNEKVRHWVTGVDQWEGTRLN